MNPRIVGTLLFLSWAACGEPKGAPAAKADAPAPVEAKAAGDAKAEDAKVDAAAKPETGADAKADVVPTREWLVWFREGDRWTTRWVGEVDGATTTIAERKALVHSTGDKLFEIARKDVTVDIRTCACLSSDFGPKDECMLTGSVVRPGLVAGELAVGDEIPLVVADADAPFGEVYGLSLQITGGVDGWLVVRSADSGYYCGAHQSIAGGDQMFDLGAAEPAKPVAWPKVELPTEVKTAAATGEMFDLYAECEAGEETIDTFVRDTMRWTGLSLALQAGAPKITWEFAADVYYACSPDYLTIGTATTDPMKEAAPLGLGGPLPAGLQRALAELGTKDAVGWAELKLPAESRAKTLERFNAVDETPWPPAESAIEGNGASATPEAEDDPEEDGAVEEAEAVDTATAAAKLSEARKLTRAKDYTAAIAAFDAAIAADPSMAKAWAGRGYAKLLDGQLARAKKDCEHALTLDTAAGFQASVYYNLGLIAQGEGNDPEAKKAFRKSLDLRPNDEVQKAFDAL